MDPPDASFRGYEKMYEDTQAWELSDADARMLKRTQCAVLEKIHGANLCFICEAHRVRTAKRHGILSDSEDFFGHRDLLNRIRPHLERVRLGVIASLPAGSSTSPQVLIFGEIFGGSYPHPSVTPVQGVQAIQTGVYYSPGIDFSAFDIAVRASDSEPHSYLNFEQALTIFQNAGLLHSAPLSVGPWNECLSFPLPFNSTIPALLGLPALKENRAEGVVIKALKEMRFATRQGGATRAILKKKIAEFAEDKRFHQAQKWTPPAAPAGGLPALTVLLLEADALLVDNRLAAAVSKVGPLVTHAEVGNITPHKAHMKEVLAMIVADVEEELSRRFPAELRTLSAPERGTLCNSLTEQAKGLILNAVKRLTGKTQP